MSFSPIMERYHMYEKEKCGACFKARDQKTGKLVAWDKHKIAYHGGGISKRALREIAILKQLDHPCVVKILNQHFDEEYVHVIFEYIGVDLEQFMYNTLGPLESELVKSLASQLVQGIAYCHMNGIMHRDVKPRKIVVSSDGHLKLAGFKLARKFTPPLCRTFTHEVITLYYRPPEILLGNDEYGPAVDMWSVGVVIAEMTIKRKLLQGDSEIDQVFKIFRMFGTPTEESWPTLKALPHWNAAFPEWSGLNISKILPSMCPEGLDLIQQLLTLDPNSRLTAHDAMAHSYVMS